MAKKAEKKTRTTTEDETKKHNALMADAKEREKLKHHDPDSGLLRPRTFALHP